MGRLGGLKMELLLQKSPQVIIAVISWKLLRILRQDC